MTAGIYAKTDDSPEFVTLPLDKVHPSEANPRKTFDQAALDELAKSIAQKGVLEPILVRPAGKHSVEQVGTLWYVVVERKAGYGTNKVVSFKEEGDARAHAASLNERDGWEIVCGERRFKASKLAGKTTIPALVRNLSDKEAAEVAVIENDQREDVPPLEQAEGYRRLIDLGDDVESIAAKIGRPPKYVAARLTLTNLIPTLAEDLRGGKLPFGHAHLLARLPAKEQEAFLETEGLYEDNWYRGQSVEQVISMAQLRQLVKEEFTRELSSAPWNKDDETLVPEAGACSKCMKRSGANPTLFDELLNGDPFIKPNGKLHKVGRDVCTDRTCYAAKQDAFLQLQMKKVAEKNPGAEPLKISDRWHAEAGVLGMDRYEIVSKKEAKEAKPGEVKEAVIVDGENIGKVVTVRVKKPSQSRSSDSSFAQEERQRRRKAQARGKAALAANGQVAAGAERCFAEIGESPTKVAMLLRAIVKVMADEMWHDAVRLVCKRRNLLEGRNSAGMCREILQAHAGGLNTGPEIFALLAELVAARVSQGWSALWTDAREDAGEREWWSAWGIKKGDLIKAAEAEAKSEDKKPEKPAAAKTGKKPAKRKAVKA